MARSKTRSEEYGGGFPPAEAQPARKTSRSTIRHSSAEFNRLERMAKDQHSLPDEAVRAIDRMSLAALREMVSRPITTDSETWMTALATQDYIADELIRRDSTGSLQWAEEQSSKALLDSMINAAVRIDPGAAKPFIDAHHDEFGPCWARQLAATAYSKAVGYGADAMIEVESIFGPDEVGGFGFSPGSLPKDFDFDYFVSKSGNATGIDQMAKFWAAQNREAAFNGVHERLVSHPEMLGMLAEGIAAIDGQEAALRWAASKLPELPEECRSRALGFIDDWQVPNATRTAVVMGALSTDDERIAYVRQAYRPLDDIAPGIAAMRCLGSEDLKVKALQSSAAEYYSYSQRSPEEGVRLRNQLQRTMEELQLSEAAKARVLADLDPR